MKDAAQQIIGVLNTENLRVRLDKIRGPILNMTRKNLLELTTTNNDEGTLEMIRRVRDHLDSMDVYGKDNVPGKYHSLVELYPERTQLIYRVDGMGEGSTHLYKQGYTFADDGNVSLVGTPTEVIESRQYTEVTSNKQISTEVTTMTAEQVCEQVKEVVTKLIANVHVPLKEDDREWLEKMELAQLEKLNPVIPETKPTDNVDATSATDVPKVIPVVPVVPSTDEPKTQTAAEYVNNAPEGIRDLLGSSLIMHNQRRDLLITKLTANKNCQFTADQLKIKPLDELNILMALSGGNAPPVDFTGNSPAGITPTAPVKVEPLEVPTMNFETKK